MVTAECLGQLHVPVHLQDFELLIDLLSSEAQLLRNLGSLKQLRSPCVFVIVDNPQSLFSQVFMFVVHIIL